ncbi:MAG: long-chain fatty acid--CoA ligase [Fimbriimonadaceae bacterium]|nr:MAG: long-chain fatty acid--CoA ligase [Fimbriimonadaceae bacterium]
MLRHTARANRERPAFHVPEGRGFRTVSYAQAWEDVRAVAKGLLAAGLKKGDRLALCAETSQQWAYVDWAAQTLGLIVVPIFPTLPADQAQLIANHSGSRAVVVQDAKQATKFPGVDTYQLEPDNEVVALGRDQTLDDRTWDAMIDAVGRDDVATVIYTSGTTGVPKGATLLHGGFLDLCHNIRRTLPVSESDVWLSFLPLAHVFERFAGHVLPVSLGASVAYAGSVTTLARDMTSIRPTVMLCVPRLLETIRQRIVDNVQSQPKFRQWLFGLALQEGLKQARGETALLAGLLDRLVGAKIRERTGGRMRFFVSGGAALPSHVAEFFMAFRVTVLQGYGLTETTAATCINHPDDNDHVTVGKPIDGVEVKLAGDGEILVKGTAVMRGYWDSPEETAAAIDPEGWFHTGDIGEFKGDKLRITDRKKDIIVLASGKNVAPQRVEGLLKESEFIQEAVVFGDGLDHCIALVAPSVERVSRRQKAEGKPELAPAQMVEDEFVKALIKAEIDRTNKRLADFERVKGHLLTADVFSVESGELTPSLKVKRKVVYERYKEGLERLG